MYLDFMLIVMQYQDMRAALATPQLYPARSVGELSVVLFSNYDASKASFRN